MQHTAARSSNPYKTTYKSKKMLRDELTILKSNQHSPSLAGMPGVFNSLTSPDSKLTVNQQHDILTAFKNQKLN